jgi:hypothetical protein
VRAYCQENRIDQAILGSGTALPGGGYHFQLVVYDRKADRITTDQEDASSGVLDVFDVTDALVASLLDGLSGTHLLFGSLSIESDPAGALVSVNGKDVGAAPLSLRGLPVGELGLMGRMDGREAAKSTVTITDGETTSVSLRLLRSMGTLVVRMPKDAVAKVRSTEIGQKELTGPGTVELPTADYDVEADCPGLVGVSGKVTVNAGANTSWLPWPKGYIDVQSDPPGATIVVDGQERGATPLVVDLEPGTLHQLELKRQNYQTYRSEVSGDAGSKTHFSESLTALESSQPPSTAAPQGRPLPQISIKMDGNFDVWKSIPAVIVGSQNATDNKTISKVSLAADTKNLYIEIDIADRTPSSLFHPFNFSDYQSYAITIDDIEGPKNATVALCYNEHGNQGWFVLTGARSKGMFHFNPQAMAFPNTAHDHSMKGSSVEIEVPLERIKGSLGGASAPTKTYRILGWTSKGRIPFTSDYDLKDLQETKAGYFIF